MIPTPRTVELNGSDSALVVAALFALAHWPFETKEAKELVSDTDRTSVERIESHVFARWRDLLEVSGLWEIGSRSMPAVNAKRAALTHGVALNEAELRVAILALDAVALEFSDDWDEFCIAIPGGLGSYPFGPPDVPRLARHLETMLPAR